MEYFCSGCAIILMVKMLKDDSKHINAINTLIRQTSRWAIASENDDNPVIRLLRLLIESVSSFSINLRIIKIKNPAVRAPAIGNPTFSATCKNSSI